MGYYRLYIHDAADHQVATKPLAANHLSDPARPCFDIWSGLSVARGGFPRFGHGVFGVAGFQVADSSTLSAVAMLRGAVRGSAMMLTTVYETYGCTTMLPSRFSGCAT